MGKLDENQGRKVERLRLLLIFQSKGLKQYGKSDIQRGKM